MSAQEQMMQIGDTLAGRYRIVGQGNPQDIGTSYRAYDSHHDRLVVVLVLASRYASGEDVLERLDKSQQAVGDLAVPALVPIEDAGVVAGQLYLVRALADGYPLAELLARIGPLPSDAAVQIAIHLCDALAPAHRAGLVHGSLSPHCVLVQDDGLVLVTDVGLLPALRPASAVPGRPWGRAPYLSPEQAAGESVHLSSDVYVIGSLLYEMLAGRPPFRAQDETVLAMRHLRQDPPSLQMLVPDVPPRLAQIVHKALAKEPASRYRNAGQLGHILRAQLGPTPALAAFGPEEPALVAPSLEKPDLAAPQPAPRREQLIVPAPPLAQTYEPGPEFEGWPEEPAGKDWLMVVLIVAALIAVLGLIPLWRTVYRRYATPPPTPLPALYQPFHEDLAWPPPQSDGTANETNAEAKLDDFGLVWYNLLVADHPVLWPAIDGVSTKERGSPG
jgi:serine/threonine protein kinase